MNKRLYFILLLVVLKICGYDSHYAVNSVESNLNNNQRRATDGSGQASRDRESLPSNVVIDPSPEAAKVPILFYSYINQKKYELALILYGPDLKSLDNAAMNKYIYNIKHISMTGFKDVSGQNPPRVGPDLSKFYAVKFYYAVLSFEQYNPSLNQMLNSPQDRLFTVARAIDYHVSSIRYVELLPGVEP